MWFKHRAWVPVAWLLCLVNIGGVWFAAGPGGGAHATLHALLAVLFGLGAQRLAARNRLTPDADAAGKQVEGQPADQQKLENVEGRLAELEDRLDFTERVLVDVRKRAQQPPKE